MAGPQQTTGADATRADADATTADERLKVAGRCLECGAVYSAWLLTDGTVQPIGRKDGCQCGGTEFEALSE